MRLIVTVTLTCETPAGLASLIYDLDRAAPRKDGEGPPYVLQRLEVETLAEGVRDAAAA